MATYLGALWQQLNQKKKWVASVAVAWYIWHRVRPYTARKHAILSISAADRKELGAPDPSVRPLHMQNKQGLWLLTHRWEVEDPIALVFVVHGYGEHMGRYEHVARLLNEQGYSVFGIDHQGHGLSDGDRCYVEKFQHLVQDYLQFVSQVQAETKHAQAMPPCFLLGHSMGGCIAIHIVRHSSNANVWPWTGVVLSGPAIQAKVKPYQRFLANTFAALFPKAGFEKLGAEKVTRNRQLVQRYKWDPLVYSGGMRFGMGKQLLDAMDEIVRTMKDFSLPYLLVHGGDDLLCDVKGSRLFHTYSSSKDKQLIVYPDLYHELFNEPERAKVLEDVIQWLNARVPK